MLEDRHFVKMEPSMASKKQFNTFMDLLCISTADMPHSEYMTNYIAWEEVEFMDGIQELWVSAVVKIGLSVNCYLLVYCLMFSQNKFLERENQVMQTVVENMVYKIKYLSKLKTLRLKNTVADISRVNFWPFLLKRM